MRCSQPLTIRTRLQNPSPDLAADDARVMLEMPPGVGLLSGSPEQQVSGGRIDQSETSELHSWSIEATTDGPKHLTLTGIGEGLGTEFRRMSTVDLEVDCKPPGTTIDSGPSGPTNHPAPEFGFSATADGTRFECAVDGTTFSACTSPLVLRGLGGGEHSFSVRAADEAGNLDPSPAVRRFEIDRTVSGARLRPLSSRIRHRARNAGAVRVRLGEPGSVRVTASVSFGPRTVGLRSRRFEFAEAGHRKAKLTVPMPQRRSLRRAAARRKRIVVRVEGAFSDRLGTKLNRVSRFRLR